MKTFLIALAVSAVVTGGALYAHNKSATVRKALGAAA